MRGMRMIAAPRVRDLLLVFDKGDDFGPALLEFARRNAIGAGSFHAIGALSEATLAFWNPQTKAYEEIPLREQLEVVSMSGNITPSSDDLKLHAHAVLGKRDGSTAGGHFVRGLVYPTVELFLTVRDTPAQRKKDPDTGLWRIDV
jgi:predicted DNA-binding protein with PD1-like motif